MSALETETQGVRGKAQSDGHGVALPTRDEQVEQDRAHGVQLHHAELEGYAVDIGGSHRQPDSAHDKQQGAPSRCGAVQIELCDGREGVKRTDESTRH